MNFQLNFQLFHSPQKENGYALQFHVFVAALYFWIVAPNLQIGRRKKAFRVLNNYHNRDSNTIHPNWLVWLPIGRVIFLCVEWNVKFVLNLNFGTKIDFINGRSHQSWDYCSCVSRLIKTSLTSSLRTKLLQKFSMMAVWIILVMNWRLLVLQAKDMWQQCVSLEFLKLGRLRRIERTSTMTGAWESHLIRNFRHINKECIIMSVHMIAERHEN